MRLSNHLWINRLTWPALAIGSGFIAYSAWTNTAEREWDVIVTAGTFAAFAVVSFLLTVVWWNPRPSD